MRADLALQRRIIALAKPYWLHILGFTALSLLSVPLTLLKPLPLKLAVDSVLGSVPVPPWLARLLPDAVVNSSTALLVVAATMIVLIVAFSQIQVLVGGLLQSYTGEKLVLDFRAQLFGHVQRLSLSYHDRVGTADSMYRIQYDASSIQNVTVNRFVPLLTSLATLAGMIYVMFLLDWQVSIVALAVSPVLMLLMRQFRRKLKKRWKQVKRLDSSANSVIQEVLSSVRVVMAFGREEHEQLRFRAHSDRRVAEQMRVSRLQGVFDFLINLTVGCGTAAALYVGVTHVRSGVLTVGELVMVMAYLGQLYDPLRTISKRVADLQSSLASAERAFELLDNLPDVVESPHARSLGRAKGDISFQNVSFSYGEHTRVLHGTTLDVPAGMRVGIYGRTGAGKTTLMSLLARFYDVTDGRILVDHVDIRDYKIADLRNQFGIVLQDAVLFSTTIRENIAYGRPGAKDRDIVEAATLANAHEFISKLPGGYETVVGERGMTLSGGERQRLSLARAFLKDAPILILDEPTSSVDLHTESAIMEALERLMRGRTTFMIAHRLSTLENCDIRLVVEDGRTRVFRGPWSSTERVSQGA